MIPISKYFLHELNTDQHCVKGVRIRSFSVRNLPAFGLNTEIFSVSSHTQSEFGKIRTRKSPNTDTFHAVQNDI